MSLQWDPMCSLGETGVQTLNSTAGTTETTYALSSTQGMICELLSPTGPHTEVLARYVGGALAGQPAATRNPPQQPTRTRGSAGAGSVVYAGMSPNRGLLVLFCDPV
jgi:hypothetical protein